MKKLILIIGLFIFFSCNENPISNSDLEYKYALAFIIKADSIRQKALLSYINDPNEKYSNYPKLIENATFQVNNVTMEYNPEIDDARFFNIKYFYNYYSDRIDVRSTDTFLLQIYSEKLNVHGQTVLPGDFNIIVQNKSVRWTKSKNAYSYLIVINNLSENKIIMKSTKELGINLNSDEFSKGLYEIEINAYDKNYFNYIENKDDPSGITGAYGVFGSVRTKRIVVNIE